MKLSTAIRKGCEQHPQDSGRLFTEVNNVVISSCVLGAALVGVYGQDGTALSYSELAKVFPLLEQPVNYPPGAEDFIASESLSDVMIHLNDRAGWTREKIADWVETVEDANETV